MPTRSYRVTLVVDVEVTLEDDQYGDDGPDEVWIDVEEELERAEYWGAWHDDLGNGYATYAKVDSYGVED